MVDDDAGLRRAVRRVLVAQGFDVDVAEGGDNGTEPRARSATASSLPPAPRDHRMRQARRAAVLAGRPATPAQTITLVPGRGQEALTSPMC